MKIRHSLKLASAALAFVSFGIATMATVSAQDATAAGGDSDSFQTLDANHDGHLARSEIPEGMSLLRTRMSTYDANHDGVLDAREYATAHAALEGGGHANGADSRAPTSKHNEEDPTGT